MTSVEEITQEHITDEACIQVWARMKLDEVVLLATPDARRMVSWLDWMAEYGQPYGFDIDVDNLRASKVPGQPLLEFWLA